jgi:hypothetical protein
MVANPVAVLTQAKAKVFLAQGKATKHYKLFQEATLLGPLTAQVEATEMTLKDIDSISGERNALLSSIGRRWLVSTRHTNLARK